MKFWIIINIIRSIPSYLAYKMLRVELQNTILKDLQRWNELVLKKDYAYSTFFNIHILLLKYPEFRNLFYYRVKCEKILFGILLNVFYPKLNSLFLSTPKIGSGFVIFHGFSTILYCKEIGENCSIGQQVTVGMTTDYPTIKDNVKITAGAVVIGGITIHSNCTIGANATVSKSIPENCVVVGNPAYIVRKNGMKVREDL